MAESSQREQSPAEKVFNIFESAEQIFLQLPMRDLLVVAQRLTKHSASVTKSSTKLQQALFFEPITDFALEFHYEMPDDSEPVPRQQIFRHPLIYNWLKKATLSKVEVAHPQASWRRQLLTQPPLAEVEYFIVDRGIHDTARSARGVGLMDVRMVRPGPPREESYVGSGNWRILESGEASYAQIVVAKSAMYNGYWHKVPSRQEP